MSYIFWPERYLLKKYIKKHSSYIEGQVLDVGAGRIDWYKNFFDCEKYLRMDIFKNDNIDIVGRAKKIPFFAKNYKIYF